MRDYYLVAWNMEPGYFWVSNTPSRRDSDNEQFERYAKRGLAFERREDAMARCNELNAALLPLIGDWRDK